MNESQEVSIKFINTITGDKKLQEYEQRLENIYGYISSIKSGQNKATKEVKNTVQSLGKEIDNTKNKTKDMGNVMRTAFSTVGIIATIKASTKLFKSLSNLIDKSSDYVENLNLLEVAYADIDKSTNKFNRDIEETSEEIEKFIDKMATVYGLDESKLTRQFGIFKQLANAMKLPYETGSKLSELMVKMTNDIASLYNLDIDRASNALQSALAGQVRPIRTATGADITEKTLQQTVDALGLDRSIKQLSYVEKRLIMVISLTEQLKASQGDWGRTLNESVANQLRMLTEQWNRLSRAVGNVFMPIIAKVLPYLNAVLMVLTEIFNLIASLLGFKLPKFDYTGLVGASDAVLDLEDGMEGAGASADKLKSKLNGLRGFDKLNVINTPKNSSSSAGAGGIDPAIMDAFNAKFADYNDMMDQVNNKAREIADKILEWLGFTDGTYKNLKKIAVVLGVLGGLKIFNLITKILKSGLIAKLIGSNGLVKALNAVIKPIKVLGGKDGIHYIFLKAIEPVEKLASALGMSLGTFGLVVGAIGAVAGAVIYLYNTNEEFRKKVDELINTVKKTLLPLIERVWEILKKVTAFIIEQGQKIWNDVLQPLISILIDVLEPIFEVIIDVLSLLWKNVLDPILNIVINIGETILSIIAPVIKLVIDLLAKVMENIKKTWDTVKPFFDFLVGKITNVIKPVIEGLGGILDWILSLVRITKDAIQEVVNWWNNLKFNKKTVNVEWSAVENPRGDGSSIHNAQLRKADGGIFANGKWHDITTYAGGGLPPVGQMFVARENGPELVGKIGSHTAVMNNDQIVGSVANGVYNAVRSAMGSQNQGTQVYNIYLDENHKIGTYTLEQLQDMAKTNGRPITITG